MIKKQYINESKQVLESESEYVRGASFRPNREFANISSESGRSMVEMLGVLAIMGVLAIGGIAGYRYAMDKYNANEILNEVRKRAVTASQQRMLGRTIDLSEWSNTIQGHPVTAADNYGGDTSFFALTVSGIEQGVCDQVIKEKILFAVEEKVGEVVVGEDTTCAEGENAVTFAFANDLNAKARVSDDAGPSEPTEPKECPSGWTGNDCKTPDQSCNGHGMFMDEPGVMTACICETGWGGNNCDVACPNDQYPLKGLDFETAQPNGTCYSCSTDSFLASGDGCSKCSNRFVAAVDDVSVCAPCSFGMAVPATEAECSKCPNREMVNGACVSKCEDGLRNKYGDCVPCSTGQAVSVTEAECSKCPNREMVNGACMSKCEDGFRDYGHNCHACSIGESVSASAVECAKCDATDTPRMYSYGACYRQTCDLNQFRSYGNACISCDDPKDVHMSAMEDTECKKCGRYWVHWSQKYGPFGGPTPSYCVRTCPTGLAPNPETQDCVPGKDYFFSYTNYLFPCSYSGGVYVASEEACAVCDTTDTPRQATREKGEWVCRLK